MAPNENEMVIRRWADALNSGDIDGAISVLAPDFAGHFTGMKEPVRGREGFKQMYMYFIRPAFPDQRITIERTVTAGDKIAAQTSWTATHQGPFMNVPPTKRRIVVPGTGIFRIVNGMIAEEWMQEDFLGIYQQLTEQGS